MSFFNLYALSLVSMLVLLVGCGGGDSSTESESVLQGHWERKGYGQIYSVEGQRVTSYDYSSQTCVELDTFSLAEFESEIESIGEDETEFYIEGAAEQFSTTYEKMAFFPVVCESPIGAEPTDMFEHVWHSFNDYYAFFEERDVNWLQQYDLIRDDIDDDMSEQDLFDALSQMVSVIDDVHVKIKRDEAYFSPGEPKGFYQDFIDEFESQSVVSELQAYFDQEIGLALAIIDQVYLDGEFKTAGGASNQFVKWGLIDDDIGYLSIGAFIFDFERSIEDQVEEMEEVIDQALLDLADTEALIVDVRLSPGGTDVIAIAIANHFADTDRLAFSKITRTIQGETDPQEFYLSPTSGVAYHAPVVVLTSGFSASATEAFTLSMRALPQVTQIGEPTIGALSDVLEKTLPNGWQFELANEVYFDPMGEVYENVGIPPHVPVGAFEKEERENGEDSALNAALDYLGVF